MGIVTAKPASRPNRERSHRLPSAPRILRRPIVPLADPAEVSSRILSELDGETTNRAVDRRDIARAAKRLCLLQPRAPGAASHLDSFAGLILEPVLWATV